MFSFLFTLPWNRIAGIRGKHIFNFIRNSWTVLQSSWTNFTLLIEYMKVSLFPHACHHLEFSVPWILAIIVECGDNGVFKRTDILIFIIFSYMISALCIVIFCICFPRDIYKFSLYLYLLALYLFLLFNTCIPYINITLF